MINSALISAQNRQRLYWTNIGLKPQGLFGDLESTIEQPKDKCILLKDILEENVVDKYYLSGKMISWLERHSLKRGNEFKKTDGNRSASCLTVSGLKNVNLSADFICHNTMPRSSTTGKGGSGALSRNDGKTYCLDTGQTNAIEILGGDFRYDEGYRWRDGGKSGTLCTNAESFAKIDSKIRRLTPIECERLQTVNDNYTAHVSDSQRYKMLGNGWTIDVIVHILKYIK